MKNDTYNIIFGGIGGQGILKASEICGWAAVLDGFHVKKSEVHGMAQRGGSVESHLRFGKNVYSPLIGEAKADYLVCFHEEEHGRLKPFLKPKGTDLLNCLIKARESVTNPRHLNTFMVGLLAAQLPISEKSWLKALKIVFKKKILKENVEVFLKAKGIGRS